MSSQHSTTIADLAADSPLTYEQLTAENEARTLAATLAAMTPQQRIGAAAVVAERRGVSVSHALACFGRLMDEAGQADDAAPAGGAKRLLCVITRGPAFDSCPLLDAWAQLAQLRAELDASRAQVTQLRRRLDDATWNKQLNCPKRERIEDAWSAVEHGRYALILFDLDGLNALNYQYGYDGVNARIAAMWDGVRSHLRADDLHGQWMGGDEFVIAVPALEAPGLARRIQDLLRFVGLSASRAVVAAEPSLAATVAAAERLIKASRGGARGQGARGVLAIESREAA